jgi:ClpP class serine protease
MTSAHWAVREDALQRMVAIARRDISMDSVMAFDDGFPDEPVGITEPVLTVIDGVAVIEMIGPAFRYASLMTEICGACSYEKLSALHNEALASTAVKAILFVINSPGGEVTGCADFSKQVRDGCSIKPTVAFIDGDASSAACWVATACEHIVISKTGTIGCIGVVAMMQDRRGADEMEGVQNIEIVSSQTPNKRPDVTTDAGRAQVQRSVDAQASIFLGDVARHRGVEPTGAAEQFGRGDIFVGRYGVRAGLADEVGTFDEVLADLVAMSKTALSDANSTSILPGQSAARARTRVASRATRGSRR